MSFKHFSATVMAALSLAGLFLCDVALAKDTLDCPTSLTVSETVLHAQDVPEGTQVILKGATSLPFFSMAVFSGHPRDLASLISDSGEEQASSGVSVAFWKFDRKDPYGIYLVCEYGAAGAVQVYKRASDDIRSCMARTREDRNHHPIDIHFECE
ncbi:STY0301 family protein [Xanthomonas medicagonis]|uniref:STY0301 family protein n=1 Tax=Xanthomonas medicagonis TaxID=3160841 RepID=UPI0035165051